MKPEEIYKLIERSPEGFFDSHYKLMFDGWKSKQAYDILEDNIEKHTSKRRYSDYTTFLVARSKYLKSKK